MTIKSYESYSLQNKLELKNRFVMAPMTTWSGNFNGTISSDELEYYQYRSTGVGMVITATTYAEPTGKGFSGQFYGGHDDMLDSLKSLADTIHSGGAKAILQIFHAGRKSNPEDMPDGVTLSASAIPGKREDDNIPKSMSEIEIHNTINAFKQATRRAHQAGFDGIEIHGANTYLLQQFFSPHANRREDQWGGSLINRVKFPLEIIKACMEAKTGIGNDNFIIGYRFSPEENSEPGISIEDTEFLIDQLCDTDLDYLHVSLGHYEQTSIRNDANQEMTITRVIQRINNRKPFIGVGSIYTLEDAERLMSYGVDLVAVGRQLLVDGKCIDKWLVGQDAIKYYDPKKREEEHIPVQLNGVIVSQKGWVPMV